MFLFYAREYVSDCSEARGVDLAGGNVRRPDAQPPGLHCFDGLCASEARYPKKRGPTRLLTDWWRGKETPLRGAAHVEVRRVER